MDESLFTASAYALLFLRSVQAPVEKLLAGTTLTEESLRMSDYVSIRDMSALLENIEQSGASPGWSARVGTQLSVHAHGPLGFAALSAPTLGAALRVMAEFHPVRVTSLSAELQQVGKRTRFALYDLTGDEKYARWMFEAILKVLQSLIETIMGHPGGDQVLVSFSQSAPDYVDALEGVMAAPCEFGASHTAISMPASWQHIPSPLHDESTYRSNIAKCREIIASQNRSHDPVQRVRDILASHFDRVRAGERMAAPPPGLESCADAMHLTPRTLIRRLKAGESSYKQLLEQARDGCAESLLMQAHLTVADVGDLLGYRDPANFGRAFRKWKGVTPAMWRRGQR